MDELPLALPRPRGLFGPVLELIARRVRAEVESELANFNRRRPCGFDARSAASAEFEPGIPLMICAMHIISEARFTARRHARSPTDMPVQLSNS